VNEYRTSGVAIAAPVRLAYDFEDIGAEWTKQLAVTDDGN
jgi:hypothetical protein